MKTKVNPADKLDLPEPPEGAFWFVEYDYGPTMVLCRQRKFFKWSYGRTPYRCYGAFRETKCSPRWPNNEGNTLEEELVLCAEEVLYRLERDNAQRAELNSLYDGKIYLDDLVHDKGAISGP